MSYRYFSKILFKKHDAKTFAKLPSVVMNKIWTKNCL